MYDFICVLTLFQCLVGITGVSDLLVEFLVDDTSLPPSCVARVRLIQGTSRSFHLHSDFMLLDYIYYSDQTRWNDFNRFITLFFSLLSFPPL